MTKDKRGAITRFLSIFTILYALANLASIVILCIEAGDILNILTSFSSYSIIFTGFLSIGLLATGALVVDHWKKEQHFVSVNDMSLIVSMIIGMHFAYAIINEILGIIFTFVFGGEIEFGMGLITLVTYIVCLSLVTVTKLVRKLKLVGSLTNIVLGTIIAIGITGYQAYGVITSEYSTILDIVIAVLGVLVMIFVFCYASSSISYYNKNPLVLDKAVFGDKEYDVLKSGNGYEVVKLYTYKVKEGFGQVFKKFLYLLAIAVFGCGIAFYAIENDILKYFTDGFPAFVSNLLKCFIGLNVGSGLQMVKDVTVVFIQPLMLIGLIINVFKRDAEGKTKVSQVVALGTTIALYSSLTTIFKVTMELIYNQTLDLGNYSIWEIAFVVIYVASIIFSIPTTKADKEINKAIANGSPYAAFSKKVTKSTTLLGILSIISIAVCFLMGFLVDEVIILSYPIMAGGILLLILAVALENKFPCSEFVILKRKVVEESYQVENE